MVISRYCVRFIAFFYFLGLMNGYAAASECSQQSAKAKPIWVDEIGGDGSISGVGIADITSEGWPQARSIARQNALNEFAKALLVNVESEDTLNIKRSSSDSGPSVTSEFESLSTLSSSVTLRGIEPSDDWIDNESCLYWILIKKDKEEANLIFMESRLENLLDGMQDGARSFEARYQNFQEAETLLAGLGDEANTLPNAAKFEVMREKMQLQKQNSVVALEKIRSLELLLNVNNAQQRRIGYRRLTDLVNQQRFERETDVVAEPILFYAANYERSENNDCEAIRLYQRIEEESGFSYWVDLVKARKAGLSCTELEGAKSRLREYFAGGEVSVYCFYRSGPNVKRWKKACSEIKRELQKISATTNERAENAENVFTRSQSREFDTLGSDSIALFASGAFEDRENESQSRSTKEFRFSGDFQVLVLKDQALVFEDEFSAQTGWNPVSKEMVMDVMAINVVKRLRTKLGN